MPEPHTEIEVGPPGPPGPPTHEHEGGARCVWVQHNFIDRWRLVGAGGRDLGPCPGFEEPHTDIARLADLPPLEWAALLNLHAWAPDPDAYGWHVNEPEALTGSDMTLTQFRSALSRLRRKGLVSCHQWHPGQGGALAEWLWFLTDQGRDMVQRDRLTRPAASPDGGAA